MFYSEEEIFKELNILIKYSQDLLDSINEYVTIAEKAKNNYNTKKFSLNTCNL